MSPALAHGCPDTPHLAPPCKPRVRAGLYTPRGLHSEGALTHIPVEAPCSALAVDIAEERLCPCTSGSTMLRAGDKQLRATPRSCQPQGAQSSAPNLTATPPLGKAAHGGWARGLRSGHAQAHATQPGPGPGHHAPLPRPRRGQVWKLFARQGGLLSISTQEPNWSCSPSLLGPSWSPVGPMAVEVCAGPGSAEVEH